MSVQTVKGEMKGEITVKILAILQEAALSSADLGVAMMRAGYGASHGKLEREFYKQKERRSDAARSSAQEQKFYNSLYKLKRDGLIQKQDKKLTVTKKGRQKFWLLMAKLKKQLPPPKAYSKLKENSDTFVIVAFDIPERNRARRNWLRGALRELGLSMVQKSLWLGKVKIPEEFIKDLKRMMLFDFIEIFEITKTGTLKHLA